MRGGGSKQRLLCCCFISVSVLAAVAQVNTTHHHQWDITINGNSAAPTIRAEQGDTVVATVNNDFLAENVAINWHGIRQNGTPWADGTEGVTQCPILPGDTFTYRFVVDRPGTFTYQVHYGRDRTTCLKGMIVVDVSRSEAEPSAYGRERTAVGNGIIDADMPRSEAEPSAYQARNGRERPAGIAVDAPRSEAEPSAYGRERRGVWMGRPSIEAVAMAGGSVDLSDDEEDGMPPEHLRAFEAYLEEVVPVDMIMASRREEEVRVRHGGAPRSYDEDMKEKLKLWAKAVAKKIK